MFILDSMVLIHAYNRDFPPHRDSGGFWDWLNEMGRRREIAIPQAVFEEIADGNDGLYPWLYSLTNIKEEPTENAIIHLPQVLKEYGNLTESDIEILGLKADPYVIAHAIALEATVVTDEYSTGATSAKNKHIPDICAKLKIDCIGYPRFLWNKLHEG